MRVGEHDRHRNRRHHSDPSETVASEARDVADGATAGTGEQEAADASSGADVDDRSGDDRAGTKAADTLVIALTSLDKTRAYRMTTATGQVLRSSALGVDQVQVLDPARPTSVAEIAASGDYHMVIDLEPVLGPVYSGHAEASSALDQTNMEAWRSAGVMTIDTTSFQAVVDLGPDVDLGPFAPGIWEIDLDRVDDVGGKELVAALAGVVIVDPVQLGQRLPAVLEEITQDPDDPTRFVASAPYADVLEAHGADVEAVTRSIAVGIAPAVGLTVDELAGFYQRYYESVPADLTITIDDSGVARSISVKTDLSDVYDFLPSPASGLDLGATDAELASARELFADTVWIVDTLTTFELDDSITISPPAGAHEDRTEAVLHYVGDLVPG